MVKKAAVARAKRSTAKPAGKPKPSASKSGAKSKAAARPKQTAKPRLAAKPKLAANPKPVKSKTGAKPKSRATAKSGAGQRIRTAAARRPAGPTTSKPAAAPAELGAGKGGLPTFYVAPRPLSAESHGAAVLRQGAGHGFAARANSVPLNAAEFPMAARHYPVLFSTGEPAMGLALLGLRDNQNLFVDADGAWETGIYVPAYIRRYPFVLMDAGQDGRYILCVDEASEHYSTGGEGRKLFEDGVASEITNRALEFCKVYQQQSEYTRQIGMMLERHGLLTANRANVKLKSGETLALGGFRMIDAKALEALGDEAFLELRKAGALPLIYAQIQSTTNWAALVARDHAPA